MNPNPTLDAMMISESEIFDGRKIKRQPNSASSESSLGCGGWGEESEDRANDDRRAVLDCRHANLNEDQKKGTNERVEQRGENGNSTCPTRSSSTMSSRASAADCSKGRSAIVSAHVIKTIMAYRQRTATRWNRILGQRGL